MKARERFIRRSGGTPEPTVESGWEKVRVDVSLTPRLGLGVFNLHDAMRWSRLQRSMMEAAIEMATLGRGKTYPNPAVGAVIVKGGSIVGKGYHRKAGLPHAEVDAIADAGDRTRGADLYVTLEPCNHYGKTPPCTQAIIESGIKRVFVATSDPNPLINGRGIRRLRKAGLEVDVGMMAEEARSLNEAYFVFMRRGRPFITLKVAQTLDGMIATKSGSSKWITSRSARAMARKLRSQSQAILVGINTVIADDPLLLPYPRRRLNYTRCILDTHLKIPLRSQIVRTARKYPVAVYCVNPPLAKAKRLEQAGVELRVVRSTKDGKVSVREVVEDLATREVMDLLVEGGGLTLSSFLKEGIYDRILCFVAPKIMGGMGGIAAFREILSRDLSGCHHLRFKRIERVGRDILLELR